MVRGSGLPVRFLDLAQPGKIGALRAGDAATGHFPRIYLDADVVLPRAVARDLVDRLAGDEPRVASPTMSLDMTGCSAVVRAYYRVWQSLPVFASGYVGSGVYAVNDAGHRRIAPFPDVTNDDEHVRRSFARAERVTTPGSFVVFPARTLSALLRRAARTRAGARELAERPAAPAAPPSAEQEATNARVVAALVTQPRHWMDLVVFLGVTALMRVRAAMDHRGARDWGRDDTSRALGGAAS
jgi:hypothetical protein